MNAAPRTPPAIVPRRLDWDFDAAIPPAWFRGSVALTTLLDVYTLLVPDNEKYYIRIMRGFLKRIDDPDLKRRMQLFFRQESMHGVAHQRYWRNLQAHNPGVARFTRAVNALLYRVLEPVIPARAHLAIVAAIEHVNAALGHVFLSRQLLHGADPRLRRLFEWHFAEEIEHKAVAHDVLAAACPGYATRLAGALLAFPLFHACLIAGTIYLLLTRPGGRVPVWRDLWGFLIGEGVARAMAGQLLRYLHPRFQPWQLDDWQLAGAILRGLDHQILEPAAIERAA